MTHFIYLFIYSFIYFFIESIENSFFHLNDNHLKKLNSISNFFNFKFNFQITFIILIHTTANLIKTRI